MLYLHGVQCHPQITLVCGVMSVFHQLLLDRNKSHTQNISRQESYDNASFKKSQDTYTPATHESVMPWLLI